MAILLFPVSHVKGCQQLDLNGFYFLDYLVLRLGPIPFVFPPTSVLERQIKVKLPCCALTQNKQTEKRLNDLISACFQTCNKQEHPRCCKIR